MKRANTNKLSINKETVRSLSPDELQRTAGGVVAYSGDSGCCNVGAATVRGTNSITSEHIIGYFNSVAVYSN